MATHTEDEIYPGITHSPDSSANLSYTINVRHFDNIPFNSDLQRIIVCTMVWNPNRWNETKLKPVIYELLDVGNRRKKHVTIPVISAVARYIKEQDLRCRRDFPGGRNAESVYWESILTYSRQYEQHANSIVARQLEIASTSTKGPDFNRVPKADSFHYPRITHIPTDEANTYQIYYRYTRPNQRKENHYLPKDSQKLIMCTILYLGWKPKMVVVPLAVMLGRPNIWTDPMIGQVARYIYDQSVNDQQTYAESVHWTTILSSDPAWENYAKRFDTGKSQFPIGKPAIKQVLPVSAPQLVASSSGPVAKSYGNIPNPYTDPNYQPPPTARYYGAATYGSEFQPQPERQTQQSLDAFGNPTDYPTSRALPNPLHHPQTGPPPSTAGGSGTRRPANRDERDRLSIPSQKSPGSGSTDQAAIRTIRNPSLAPKRKIIEDGHNWYITVEYARFWREEMQNDPDTDPTTGIPIYAVESGITNAIMGTDMWKIPHAEKGKEQPRIDDNGYRIEPLSFTPEVLATIPKLALAHDPVEAAAGQKRARSSASLSASPGSASPEPEPNRSEITDRTKRGPQGSSGHSSSRAETKEERKQRKKKEEKEEGRRRRKRVGGSREIGEGRRTSREIKGGVDSRADI